MDQSFKQDRETQYNKYEFRNHNIQLLNGNFRDAAISLTGFEQGDKIAFLPTHYMKVVSNEQINFESAQTVQALAFDVKIHIFDEEARKNAIDGLVKKYHHLKTAALFDSTKANVVVDTVSDSGSRLSVFSNNLRSSGCEPSIGDIGCIEDEDD